MFSLTLIFDMYIEYQSVWWRIKNTKPSLVFIWQDNITAKKNKKLNKIPYTKPSGQSGIVWQNLLFKESFCEAVDC